MALKLIQFINNDLWLIHEQSLPRVQAILIKALKVILLSAQGFSNDLCPLRASALTLYSLLSIVPIIAMLFGIAKGFGFEQLLQQHLIEQLPDQQTMVLQLIRFARNMLDSTKGEVVAGIGIIVLFWSIINVIGNIETSFNAIWKITHGRSLSRKFSDYLSLMLVAPIILIVASSMTVFLKTQITWLITLIQLPELGTWLVIKALGLTSLALMIGLFTFTLMFMPNHIINFRAGLIAGVVTGILYYLAQWAYITLQIGASSYNAIYGSFAALPLFVVWLQMAWMIVLFGCEIAFFVQNYAVHQNHDQFSDLSFSLKKVIALQITHLIIKNFLQVNPPLTAEAIATKLLIPIAVVQPVISKLIASHILLEYKQDLDEADEVYQPAVDIHIISIAYVINALEQCGQNQLLDVNQEQLFMSAVKHFRELMEGSERNGLLKDL